MFSTYGKAYRTILQIIEHSQTEFAALVWELGIGYGHARNADCKQQISVHEQSVLATTQAHLLEDSLPFVDCQFWGGQAVSWWPWDVHRAGINTGLKGSGRSWESELGQDIRGVLTGAHRWARRRSIDHHCTRCPSHDGIRTGHHNNKRSRNNLENQVQCVSWVHCFTNPDSQNKK